jgi:hypothetical protein
VVFLKITIKLQRFVCCPGLVAMAAGLPEPVRLFEEVDLHGPQQHEGLARIPVGHSVQYKRCNWSVIVMSSYYPFIFLFLLVEQAAWPSVEVRYRIKFAVLYTRHMLDTVQLDVKFCVNSFLLMGIYV